MGGSLMGLMRLMGPLSSGRVLGAMRVMALMSIGLLLVSCRTADRVTEDVRSMRDTVYVSRQASDTVHTADTVRLLVRERGDTVWMARETVRWRDRSHVRHDTLWRERTDTVTRVERMEVERPRKWATGHGRWRRERWVARLLWHCCWEEGLNGANGTNEASEKLTKTTYFMVEYELRVNKERVYNEVAKTTSYTGAKMDDDAAYDRIFTTAEDKAMLERFWDESKNLLAGSMKELLVEEGETDGVYTLRLRLSSSFNEGLLESMERSMQSFFVMNITAKWYTFTNKEEATSYAAEAASNVDDIRRKAFFKKKPVRPTYG